MARDPRNNFEIAAGDQPRTFHAGINGLAEAGTPDFALKMPIGMKCGANANIRMVHYEIQGSGWLPSLRRGIADCMRYLTANQKISDTSLDTFREIAMGCSP